MKILKHANKMLVQILEYMKKTNQTKTTNQTNKTPKQRKKNSSTFLTSFPKIILAQTFNLSKHWKK